MMTDRNAEKGRVCMKFTNCIAIVSGKGGTGKTTVCAGVASALAALGKTVCAVDMDIGLHNLDLALGLQDAALFDLSDAVSGRAELNRVLLSRPDLPNLSMIASPADGADLEDAEAVESVFRTLSARFDYVLLDAPAGLGRGFELSIRHALRALVVSTPDTPCMMDSATAAIRLDENGVEDAKLVLNRVDRRLIRKKSAFNVDESMDFVGLPLAGVIFEDKAITVAFNRCTPVLLAGEKSAAPFVEIARRLEGIAIRPTL